MRTAFAIGLLVTGFVLSRSVSAQEMPTSKAPVASVGVQPTVEPGPVAYVPVSKDVVAVVRYRPLGSEYLTSEVDMRLAWARSIGPLLLGAYVSVARGADIRQDTNGEAGAVAAFALPRGFRIGGEARIRGELEDRFATIEDEGRPVETFTGALVGVQLARALYLQSSAGWLSPRGLVVPGPAALTAATFTF